MAEVRRLVPLPAPAGTAVPLPLLLLLEFMAALLQGSEMDWWPASCAESVGSAEGKMLGQEFICSG